VGRVSKTSIKRLIKNGYDIKISGPALESIAKLLDAKAKRIAEYAVKRAKTHNRNVVLEEDVDTYKLKFGD
jgi:histone H3/H4